MLNRGTLLLVVSAIALGGGVLLFENRGDVDRSDGVEEARGEPLLPFEESAIAQFTLQRPNEADLTFSKDESGIWQMSAPEEKMAEGGAIAFLLSQLTRPSNRVISADSNSLEDFGLDNPEAIITLKTEETEAKENTYQILVGDADFGGDQRYVQVIDPDSKSDGTVSDETQPQPTASEEASTSPDIKIHLVSSGIISAIERPTNEWLVAEENETSAGNNQLDNSKPDVGESDDSETMNDEIKNNEANSE
ncbi:MAG: DUF4340 domain-containing protein [Phormidesmis sp.]